MPRAASQKCFSCGRQTRSFLTITLRQRSTGQMAHRHFCSEACVCKEFPQTRDKLTEDQLPTEPGLNCAFCSKLAHSRRAYYVAHLGKREELTCHTCGKEREIMWDNRMLNGEILCTQCQRVIETKNIKDLIGTMYVNPNEGIPTMYYFCTSECCDLFIRDKK